MAYHARFAPLFQRTKQRRAALLYLQGQLRTWSARRLSRWHARWWAATCRRCSIIGQSPWDAEAVLHAYQAYVGETLGDAEEGAFIIDGCDVPKQRTESVGAAVVWAAGQARQLPGQRGVLRQSARLHAGGPPALPAGAMVHPGVRGSATLRGAR